MGQPTKVLYIEDDRESQRLVQRVLGSYGYEVLVATDGLSGIALANQSQPQLILIDINLPHMDGRAITTRLRTLPDFTHIPIVALTANIGPGNRELALAAGCTGFLTKPIDVDAFPAQIESFLRGDKQTLTEEERGHHLEKHTHKIVEQLEKKVKELEETNEELYRLDRMKSDFLVLASHELRTPLTLINGYAALLSAHVKEFSGEELAPIVRTADKLSAGVARMRQVVDEIIRISRIASGLLDLAVGPVRPIDLVEGVVARFKEVCDARSLHLYTSDLKHLPFIQADGEQIQAAITHLLENAIKYTPDGRYIYILGRPVSNGIELIIRDTGVGIPVEARERIFEPFYVLDPGVHYPVIQDDLQGNGLGLGLAVARGIIQAHNGRVWAESEGCDLTRLPGSTFHVMLPLKVVA